MVKAIAEVQGLSECHVNLIEMTEHHHAYGAHTKRTARRIAGAVGHRKIAVDIHLVVCQQLIDVGERRTRYAFRELNLAKLMTEVFVENEASRRALERSGYRTIGTSRDHFFTGGRWHDIWLGEVLREDWERAQKA